MDRDKFYSIPFSYFSLLLHLQYLLAGKIHKMAHTKPQLHLQQQTALCWFQTSLPLAALPLHRTIIACCFMVYSSQRPRCFGLSPSGIAPELNWSQLYVICRGGKSGKVIDLLARRCLPFGHPSAASGACTNEQISSSSKRQCGERQASLKAALVHNMNMTVILCIHWQNAS